MNRYRIELPACIMLTVDAESEKAAIEKAWALANELTHGGGLDMPLVNPDGPAPEARLYCDTNFGEAEVADEPEILEGRSNG